MYIGTAGEAPRRDPHGGIKTCLPPASRQVGAKVVTYARYVIFEMAEVGVPRRLFRAILERTCLPQAGSSAQAAGTGADMTEAHDGTADGRGGAGDGLLVPGPSIWMKAVSGSTTAPWQTNGPCQGRERACECPES